MTCFLHLICSGLTQLANQVSNSWHLTAPLEPPTVANIQFFECCTSSYRSPDLNDVLWLPKQLSRRHSATYTQISVRYLAESNFFNWYLHSEATMSRVPISWTQTAQVVPGHKGSKKGNGFKTKFLGVLITSSQSAFHFSWGINCMWHKCEISLNSSWIVRKRKLQVHWADIRGKEMRDKL